MKSVQLYVSSLLLVMVVVLAACSGQSTTDAPTTAVPTTVPLLTVEQAILAANARDYDTANKLLDVSAVAQAANFESVNAYWNWITSNQRVSDVAIREEETRGETKRLFITLQNANYPTLNVGFWIRWEVDRWVAFDN